MSRRVWGYIATFLGIVSTILGATADLSNLGATPGFGYVQIGAIVIGIVLIAIGAYLATRREDVTDAW